MTTITKNKNTLKRVILLVVGCLLLGYCLLTILPWQPIGYGYSLEESWASALHLAFQDKIQFGKDFISAYGPYGFLQVIRYYFPETYGYGFGFSCLIAIAAWAGLFKLIRHCVSLGEGAVFWLIPILWFFPNSDLLIESFQLPLLILPLVLYFYVSKKVTPALVLTIINASLSSLTEHSYFLLAIASVALITIDEVINLKRIPRSASIYLAFLWIFWMFAAQDLANIPAYIANSLEIVKGYSASMGTPGELKEVLFYLFGTGVFLLLVGAIEWTKRRWWGILPTLGLAAAFFAIFKGSFTRHDSHALQAVFSATPIMLMFTAVLWSSITKNWHFSKIKLPLLPFLGAVAISMVMMSSLIFNNYLGHGYGIYALKVMAHNFRTLPQVARVLIGREDFLAMAEQGKAAVRGANILPSISGTVDLYPNETATIFAHDLEYQPRPTVQSFSAYTSKLARLNAQHLTTAEAAKNILFDLKPIDGRLASFEDGLSWLEILTRYDLTDLENSYLLLKRNSQPRSYKLKPVVEQVEVGINEWFEIKNASQPIWSKINIDPNLIGNLTTAILRLPPLNIEIETADGSISSYRTVGDVMDEGFLLSPLLSSRWDFMNFAAPNWQNKLASKQVKRFRIVAEGFNAKRYPQKYKVSLSQIELERQSFDKVAGWQDWSDRLVPIPLEGHLQRVDLDDSGKTGWMAHAPMKMAISLKGTEQSFSVNFGILEQAVIDGLEQRLGDGVEFKIFALQSDGSQKLLFDRDLQPLKNKGDRGTQKVNIDISQMDISRLILETNEKKDASFDWSYWSDFQLE